MDQTISQPGSIFELTEFPRSAPGILVSFAYVGFYLCGLVVFAVFGMMIHFIYLVSDLLLLLVVSLMAHLVSLNSVS